jgi:FtsP/CotA-like multicopper oxidase with cupredoxin domain
LLLCSSAVNTVNHPFHLHGYQLHVTGLGQLTDNSTLTVDRVKQMLAFQPATYRLRARKHVIKDTISIPSKGFTIFRLKAENPGFWLLHCHFGKIFKNLLKKFITNKYFIRMAHGCRNGSGAASR